MKNLPKCIDCRKELKDYQSKRCWNCYCEFIKIAKNNSNYKGGITKKKSKQRKYGSYEDRSKSKEYLENQSKSHLGQKAWNKGLTGSQSSSWIDGRSFEPYTSEFNEHLKELIRKRDNHTCQKCGKKQKNHYRKLDIHHIDYNKANCKEENLIALCQKCNSKVNFDRKYWQRYFSQKITRKEE